MRPLTKREREVMVRVAFGMSNDAIGDDLGCSPETVRTHVQNVLTKLRARNRAHAIGILYRTGWPETFSEKLRHGVDRRDEPAVV